MRSFSSKWILLFLLAAPLVTVAQSGVGTSSIFDDLQLTGGQKGTLVVKQSDQIRKLVGVRHSNTSSKDDDGYLHVQGYRAQVFSGNNQRSSKEEAFRKEREIHDAFPDLTTYVTYNAPFWKLRVGDFRTHEEAYQTMRKLMAAFPAYGKEMYIVREEVRIPLND